MDVHGSWEPGNSEDELGASSFVICAARVCFYPTGRIGHGVCA